jgi:hypothetical protein
VRLTQTGMVLGTPLYMSPEQARGDENLDQRIDIYALGVIMYEATTGRVPFVGNNYLSVISQVLNEDARPPREIRPDLSEELEAIVMRAMAKDRDERYATAQELLADVTALIDDPTRSTERAKITGPRRRSPRSKSPLKVAIWVALIAVVIAAVVTTVVMLFGGSEVVKRRKDPVVVPPPAIVDAAPPPVEIDAAPEAETLQVTIKSEPPGAMITVDGVEKGPAPVTLRLVVHDHYTQIVATLPDYDDKTMTVNTYADKDRDYTMKLKRTPKGSAGFHVKTPRPPDKAGSASPTPSSRTGGELGGNPFKRSPSAPPSTSPPAKPPKP